MAGSRHDLLGSLLAGVRFTYRQRAVTPGSRKGLALLFVVSVRTEPTPRRLLAELLWGPRRAHNVRQALSELRRLPGAWSWLDARDPVSVRASTDLERFRSAARAGDHAAAVAVWREATGGVTWPQPPWPILEAGATSAFHEWLEAERDELHADYLTCLQARAAELEQRAEFAEALALVRAVLATDPLAESVHRAAMRLHAAMGNPRAALAQFDLCRAALARDLDVDPSPETLGLAREIETTMARKSRPVVQPTPLPHRPIPFVGRTAEVRALEALLAAGTTRLINLVGPAGVGKTSLALELAERWGARFERGVAFASMASVAAVEAVPGALADAVGLPVGDDGDLEQQLVAYLRSRQLLLVVDDVGRVPDGEGLLASLLDACPSLVVLGTSRQPLDVVGERVFPLAGLGYPTSDASRRPEDFQAVRFLLEAARRSDGRLEPTAELSLAAGHIGRVLEGLPLGLLLVAGCLRRSSLPEIAERLAVDVRGPQLAEAATGAGHGGLEAAFGHAWDLLSVEERRALAGLTVFCGGFTRHAAQAVVGASLRTLLALTNAGLLQRDADGRFHVLEPLRRLARRWAGGDDAVADAHSRYYLHWAARLLPDLHGRRQRDGLARVAEEMGNLRSAWDAGVERRDVVGLGRSLAAFDRFYAARGLTAEAERSFAAAIAALRPVPGGEAELIRARLGLRRALFLVRLGRVDHALEEIERAKAGLDGEAPTSDMALTAFARASALHSRGEFAAALEQHRLAAALYLDVGDVRGQALALLGIGTASFALGRGEEALQAYRRAFAQAQELDDAPLVSRAAHGVGIVAANRDQDDEAVTHLSQAATLSREIGDRRYLASSLDDLARSLHRLGRMVEAEDALTECVAIRRELGDRRGHALATCHLASIVGHRDARHARELLDQAVHGFRDLGDRRGLVVALNRLSNVLDGLGETSAVRATASEALVIAADLGDVPAMLDALVSCAVMEAQEGRLAEATALLTTIRRHPDDAWAGAETATRRLRDIAARLPPAARVKAIRRGRAFSLESAVRERLLALGVFPANRHGARYGPPGRRPGR